MFRRRRAADADRPEDPDGQDTDLAADLEAAEQRGVRASGPWDVSEVVLEERDDPRVDLGSLLLTPREGVEVQIQVDESTGEVAAVIMAAEDGAVELRAFAAPRHGDIWDDVRSLVASEIARMGGTATEREGVFGTELAVTMTVQAPDGEVAEQDSTVVGVPGPRWLLRATLFGRPAVEFDEEGDLEQALRDTVVVRGTSPVPPMDALPVTMPAQVQQPTQQVTDHPDPHTS